MIKKNLTFPDAFTGEQRNEDFWFHYTEMELIRLQAEYKGELKAQIEYISSGQAPQRLILAFLENLVSKAYGERTDAGKFVKSDEIRNAFMASDAYSNMMVAFFEEEGGKAAAEFLNALMPPVIVERAKQRQQFEENKKSVSDEPAPNVFDGSGVVINDAPEERKFVPEVSIGIYGPSHWDTRPAHQFDTLPDTANRPLAES